MRRRVLIGFAVVVLALVVLFVGVWLDARRTIERERARVEAEIKVEQARLAKLRLPCLRGEPIDEPGRARIVKLIPPEDDVGEIRNGYKPEHLHWGEPLPARAAALLADQRARIEDLREALRCTRLTPPSFTLDRSSPTIRDFMVLQHLLAFESYDRASHGDMAGAVSIELDAARLGLTVEREGDTPAGPLLDAAWGSGIECEAYRQLADLVATSRLDAKTRVEIERELDLLDAAEPHAIEIWRQHGLARLRELCVTQNISGMEKTELVDDQDRIALRGWRRPLPRTIVVARAIQAIHEILARPDPLSLLGSRRALDEPVSHHVETGDPFGRVFNLMTTGRWLDVEAREALLRGALILESQRSVVGTYPSEVPLPPDPGSHDGAPLRYELTANHRGWWLWSVGENGRDDGGGYKTLRDTYDDILLERKP